MVLQQIMSTNRSHSKGDSPSFSAPDRVNALSLRAATSPSFAENEGRGSFLTASSFRRGDGFHAWRRGHRRRPSGHEDDDIEIYYAIEIVLTHHDGEVDVPDRITMLDPDWRDRELHPEFE